MGRKKLGAGRSAVSPAKAEKIDVGGSQKVVARCVPPFLLPTGSTLLNLALSDNPYGGYVKGTIVIIVGDRSAGKTFVLWTLFAELLRLFYKYMMIYDEPEAALQFALKKLFGEKIGNVELNITSSTIQDFYRNVMEQVGTGKPFVYGLDSWDSLTSEEEEERDGVGKGGYKTEKAIASSEIFRQIVRKVKDTESLVAVIFQTRVNIGVTFGKKKTRSGGNAPGFYATHEMWLRIVKHLKRKEREVGVLVEVNVEKNKFTGKLRKVQFPIFFDYGIDDVGSMVDWLLLEKFWKKDKNTINCGDDFPKATREKLITYIEDNNLEGKLIEIVAEGWQEIEKDIQTDRKPRYE